jgi:hypothetical protein
MARRSIVLAVALLLVLALAPGAAAREHGTDRPIWSNQSGEINFHLVGVPGEDPCPVLAISDSYGTMSHLGKVRMHWEHCSPVTLPAYTNEHFTITAADGDTLVGTYDINGEPPYAMVVTNGTGRFDEATGALDLTFGAEGEWANGFPVNPWQGWWQMKGTISY